MEKLEYNIKIQITDIKVEENLFSFDYELDVNNDGLGMVSHYEDEHAWGGGEDNKVFLKILQNGYALQCVIEDLQMLDILNNS